MNLKSTSKYISLILRHKPEAAGITLDEHGWADVEELIAGVNKTHKLTMDILKEIVDTDEKQRYSFNEDKTLIRANQGHSIPVDVELKATKPPQILYHGTGQKSVESIDRQGLLPRSRLYVHLSGDIETAIKVGRRHGKPVVYEVLSGDMENDGYIYYRSVNGVWLTKTVPVKYLRKRGDL
ncbi:MAG: RNA 2'-phosphotransferase [Lachnospiraceae bacterium]|nr:RNA 2'-phosphotransferase [Lachnospiraceae bacterium]